MDQTAGDGEDSKGDITVRIDLQDLYRANPKAFLAVSAVIIAVVRVRGSQGGSRTGASSPTKGKPPAHSTSTSTGTTPIVSDGVTTPNPNYHPAYASNVPVTALDKQLAPEYGAGGSAAAQLEAMTPPSPAWTREYPEITSTATSNEEEYAAAFVEELLDRDYRHQSRSELAEWVSAESADESLSSSLPLPLA